MISLPVNHHVARVNGIRMHYVTAGSGKPLYFLHGFPQTWYLWRKMIPLLSEEFELIMPDLRGYGDSDKPAGGYDKRTMALDIHELTRQLGHTHFGLCGHDRGARVAHRFALDHPDHLAAVSLLDIVPTKTVFDNTEMQIAAGSWHWFFFQVPDLAEKLIEAEPETVLRYFFRTWSYDTTAIDEDAVAEYLRAFRLPGSIRAALEDYRAGAKEDLALDGLDAHKLIHKPLQVLWGQEGGVERIFEVMDIWREKADQVEGRALPGCGHFLPEEAPEATAEALRDFFRRAFGQA